MTGAVKVACARVKARVAFQVSCCHPVTLSSCHLVILSSCHPFILSRMTTRCIIGLSSGSSVDGVDAALLEVEGAGLELRVRPVLALHQPYHGDLRELIRKMCGPGKVDGKQPALLHRLLGETFAAAARQAADRASM